MFWHYFDCKFIHILFFYFYILIHTSVLCNLYITMEKFDGQSPQPDGSELAAKLVSLFSTSLLSMLFGIKTFNVHYRYLTYSRWLILLLYIFSWTFTTVSMLLVTTNNRNYTSCFLSIMVCDIFYAGTKIAIYAWWVRLT